MADKAFALSPISARATLPSEEDYEAIREAFMETSRGRWFLNEYARRNRNADTRTVLDAVARIEEALAAQKQPPQPADDGRAEALAAIRSAVEKAEQAAAAGLDGLGLEQSLAPIRKSTRIIKEISWRWREIGADGRICDLIDSQVSAIEAGCGQIAAIDPRSGLHAAFDLVRASIEGFADAGQTVAAVAADAVAEATPRPSEQAAAARAQAEQTPAAEESTAAATAAPQEPADVAAAMAETAELTVEDADAYDEAVLDMVAAEMAASVPDEADDDLLLDEPPARVAEPPLIGPMIAASVPETAREPQPAWQPSQPVVPAAVSAEPSLGATILANGILRRPKSPASDPLAPIRRMSQAQKIAFFS